MADLLPKIDKPKVDLTEVKSGNDLPPINLEVQQLPSPEPKPSQVTMLKYAAKPLREIGNIEINRSGFLIFHFDDGTQKNVGKIGNLGIADAKIMPSGNLKLFLTNGESIIAGKVMAQDGQDGAGFIWQGSFRFDHTYYGQVDNPEGNFADVVEYQGSTYVCTGRTTLPPPGSTWQLMAAKGEDGTSGSVVFGVGGGGGGSPPDLTPYALLDGSEPFTGPITIPNGVAPNHAVTLDQLQDAVIAGGGVPPATLVPLSPTATGEVGTAIKYAREDHAHPQQAVPAAATTPPVNPGATAAVGVSTNFARADHRHQQQDLTPYVKADASVPFTGQITVPDGTAAAKAVNKGPLDSAISGVPLPAPATVVPLAPATPGVVGTTTKYAREDHAHPLQVIPAVDLGVGAIDRAIGPRASEVEVSVKDFGAKGDGNTDRITVVTSGAKTALGFSAARRLDDFDIYDTLDWLGIQLAIKHVAKRGGGTVYIPDGLYKTSRFFQFYHNSKPVDNVRLVGESRDGVVIEGYYAGMPAGAWYDGTRRALINVGMVVSDGFTVDNQAAPASPLTFVNVTGAVIAGQTVFVLASVPTNLIVGSRVYIADRNGSASAAGYVPYRMYFGVVIGLTGTTIALDRPVRKAIPAARLFLIGEAAPTYGTLGSAPYHVCRNIGVEDLTVRHRNFFGVGCALDRGLFKNLKLETERDAIGVNGMINVVFDGIEATKFAERGIELKLGSQDTVVQNSRFVQSGGAGQVASLAFVATGESAEGLTFRNLDLIENDGWNFHFVLSNSDEITVEDVRYSTGGTGGPILDVRNHNNPAQTSNYHLRRLRLETRTSTGPYFCRIYDASANDAPINLAIEDVRCFGITPNAEPFGITTGLPATGHIREVSFDQPTYGVTLRSNVTGGNPIVNNPLDAVPIFYVRRLTETQYAALAVKDPNTMYAVVPG